MAKRTNRFDTAGMPAVSGPSKAEMRRMQAQDDLRTLERAREVEGNRSRMSAVKSYAAEEARRMAAIAKRK